MNLKLFCAIMNEKEKDSMKLKNSFFYTLRTDVKDEDSKSGNLLVRSGYIKKTSAGVYMFLPLGFRVLKNIETIVREEMDKTGASELLMPCLIPEEVYINSGRRTNFGNSMFTLKDRNERPFSLGPTHEELFLTAAKEKIRSYKDMPFNIYQIGTKFRDEARPRFGLIRVREFIMKDAYSFDTSLETLDVSYQKMFQAYKNVFDRLKIDYKIVKADTGAMGGLLSEEFQAVTEVGEDILVLCENCDYASNLEISKCVNLENPEEEKKPVEKIHTPNAGTIEQVATFLNEKTDKFVKTLIYKVDGELVACMVPGNRDVNETKLKKLLQATEIELAGKEEVEKVTNAKVGFAGPIGLSCKLVMDESICHKYNFIVGANETDYHYKNVNVSDFKADYIDDIKNVQEGDPCPHCGHKLLFKKGIEIGNTFKLGTKYSESLDLKYLDSENQLQPVWMGSYGIGIGRIMAAIIEQKGTDRGLVWPLSIAPFEVGIVLINGKDEIQVDLSNSIYDMLEKNGVTVMLDDRDERPGVKFNDVELIGVPIRITVGKKASEKIVELKYRDCDIEEVSVDQLLSKIEAYQKEEQ